MFENSKVLVTGGSGFVGVNLIKRLLAMGAQVTATLHNRDAVLKDERIRYIRGDLRRQEDCQQAVQDIDYVFMCAANTSGAAVMAKTPLDLISISRDAFDKLVTHLPGVKTSMNEIFQARMTVLEAIDHPPPNTDKQT